MTDDSGYVIWSIEHEAWWAPRRRGYTLLLSEAGRYSRAEANAIVGDDHRPGYTDCSIPFAAVAAFTPAAFAEQTVADAFARHTWEEHNRLRRLLIEHFAHAPHASLATALAYELASIIAASAPDKATARRVIAHFSATQVEQIGRFGVGRPHP